MEHIVRFPGGRSVEIRQMMALLAEHNFPVQVRMVDGELTLPDEVPPEGWTDVRLGTAAGMVTLVRRRNELAVVTWGNADDAMQRAWNAVTWAVATAAEGEIVGPGGSQSAEAFRASSALPNTLRK